MVLERDNRTGNVGVLKTLVRGDLARDADKLIASGEKLTFDIRPALTSNRGWITDKPEGVAVLPDGRTLVVTDNGVEDWSGETWFLDLGNYLNLFF